MRNYVDFVVPRADAAHMTSHSTASPKDRVRQRLEELGWSQAELARRSTVTETTISNFLSGARTPRRPTLRALSRALWGDEDALLADEVENSLSLRSGAASEASHALLEQKAAQHLDAQEAATEAALRDMVIARLHEADIRPVLPGPGDPGYDLAWTNHAGTRYVAELKAVAGDRMHVFSAMGIVIAARNLLDQPHQAVVVIEREPDDFEINVLENEDVAIAWPGDWTALGLQQENDDQQDK